MEVRINKEVRNYQESLFFGLSLRQFLFALLAVLVALAVYFCLHPVLGTGEIGWVCILAAFPFALGGSFSWLIYAQNFSCPNSSYSERRISMSNLWNIHQ